MCYTVVVLGIVEKNRLILLIFNLYITNTLLTLKIYKNQ